ncbi:MAG: hypothetical protein ACLP29_01670 [Dissulfurispiraceae bacterium]
MTKKKILFIGGSLNQTTIMHQISLHLSDHDCYFTPFYGDGLIKWMSDKGMLDFTVFGGNFRRQTDNHFNEHRLKVDFRGNTHQYDLVVTSQDLIVPKNIRNKKVVLVQEGMTDPENFMYHLVKYLKLPRYLASTSTTGLSHCYNRFCVASDGYRDLFIKKGVRPERLVVTGIPNFDNVAVHLDNDFPYHNFALVATSDARETFKCDNRMRFLKQAIAYAGGKPLIFKLHPNERYSRAVAEIRKYAPEALIFQEGDINPMIANCDVLITQYSSVSYIGLALGKKVHSYFDPDELKRLLPMQNKGQSSRNIAEVCRGFLD